MLDMKLRWVVMSCLFLLLAAGLQSIALAATNLEAAGWSQAKTLTGIAPEPQTVYHAAASQSRKGVKLSGETVIYVVRPEDRVGAEELAEQCMNRFGLSVRIVSEEMDKAQIVLVRREDASPAQFPATAEEARAESYRLLVDDGRAWIEGVDARGLLYGVMTFCQLIAADA